MVGSVLLIMGARAPFHFILIEIHFVFKMSYLMAMLT